jgi:hypothetical protein
MTPFVCLKIAGGARASADDRREHIGKYYAVRQGPSPWALQRVVVASRSREKHPSARYPGARHLYDLRRGYLFYFADFAVIASAGLHDQLRTT